MLGEIYGIEHSLEKLIAKGHIFKTKTDIEYVIHLYEEYGLNALQHLNGKFVIFIIDKIKQDYILLSDRYGFKTYYYNLDNNNGFIFSNVPKLITQNMKEKKIDEDGVKDFFNFGFPLNERTLIKNVKKLSPATILRSNKKGIKIARYWSWNKLIKNRDEWDFDTAVDKLGQLWIKAVERVTEKHDKFNLGLSGGRDSRAILAAMDYLGILGKINTTYTFGKNGCLDVEFAKRIAKLSGVKHKVIDYTKKEWLNNVFKAVKNSLGSLNITNIHSFSTIDINSECVCLNGFLGDAILGGNYINNIGDLLYKQKHKELVNELRKQKGIKNKKILLDFIEKDIEWKDYYIRGDLFFLDTRGRQFINLIINSLGHNQHHSYPFMDNDLINFIYYSLPEEYRVNSKIYDAMLLKFFPKYFNNLPCTGKAIGNISLEDYILRNKLDLSRTIKKINNKVVLFGASSLGRMICSSIKDEIDIIYFCDNDKKSGGNI